MAWKWFGRLSNMRNFRRRLISHRFVRDLFGVRRGYGRYLDFYIRRYL